MMCNVMLRFFPSLFNCSESNDSHFRPDRVLSQPVLLEGSLKRFPGFYRFSNLIKVGMRSICKDLKRVNAVHCNVYYIKTEKI